MARSRKWALSLMVLVSLTWSLPGSAQEFRGSIVGKITDSTGGVLPGVTVVVSNNDTKVAQTLLTDGQGVFLARLLNVGTYTVTATLQGFKKMSQPAAQVTVGDTTRVDFTLTPGGMTETIEVRAETSTLNTTTGINGGAPSSVTDTYMNRTVVFTSGSLSGSAALVYGYDGASKTLKVTKMASAPASGVTFNIV